MNKICTSVEQSKRLLELGIDVYTADMCYPRDAFASSYDEEPRCHSCGGIGLALPSWSLAALLELMPSEFSVEGKFGTFTYEIHIRKYKATNGMDLYQIAYGNYKSDGNSWKDMINTPECENLIDATFEMVCWLKENGNI